MTIRLTSSSKRSRKTHPLVSLSFLVSQNRISYFVSLSLSSDLLSLFLLSWSLLSPSNDGEEICSMDNVIVMKSGLPTIYEPFFSPSSVYIFFPFLSPSSVYISFPFFPVTTILSLTLFPFYL